LWFHTGDLGYVDEDGYLFFKDRKKDAIRRRGENISAFELEQVLIGHEAVAEVSAYAVRLDADEEVGVSVVAAPGREIEPAELVRWCEGRMSYFMVPRFIDVRDELPRTANAKVRKEVLRQEAQERLGTYWDRVAQGIEVRRS
jgi:crotonobetaine/carnitine-CoA ligase